MLFCKLEANFQRNTPFLALSVSLILILAHLILSGKQHSFPCQQTKSVPCSLKLKIFLFQYFGQFCFDILKIKTYFGMKKPKTKLPFKYSTLSFLRKFIEDPLARCKVENLWYPKHDKMLYARVVVPLRGILRWWKFF